MRSIVAVLLLAVCCFAFTGCAGMHTSPVVPAPGFIYASYTAPMDTDADGNGFGSNMGEATSNSILGWITMGDCSIKAAAAAGGVNKVNHVDYKFTNILGIYSTYTTIVYGDA